MPVDLANPGRTLHAGVILTKGVTEMIDVAPFEFFAWTDKASLKMLGFPEALQNESLDIQLHWVTENGEIVGMRSGAQIKPSHSFETCPPLDIALMGAHDPSYHNSEAESAFIRKTFEECAAFLTICGGVFAMLDAGLLEGKSVTAPRMGLDFLRKAAPHVNWVDKRWVRDGKIWSSSTLLNGTDLMRGFAEETWGGKGGMIEALLDSGHYPVRDIDFKDFQGKHFDVESF